MGNYWYYTLILKEQDFISDETFVVVVETADSFGYSVWTPKPEPITELQTDGPDIWDALDASLQGPQRIVGMSVDGHDELAFEDLETAKRVLCGQGGLIELYKTYENDWWSVDLIFDRKAGRISLCPPGDLLEDREEDMVVSIDLEGLFRALCERLKPIYGYSADSYRVEAALALAQTELLGWEDILNAARNLNQPPLLFWLNYFDSKYLQHIDRTLFDNTLGAVMAVSERGLFIQLAEHPWQAPVAVLKDGKYRVVGAEELRRFVVPGAT